MASRRQKRAHIEALINSLAPRIAESFLEAIDNIKSGAQVSFIEKALRNNDLDSALFAVQASPAAFTAYVRMIEEAYLASGELTTALFPPLADPVTGMRLVVRFDGRNPVAERYLKDSSSTKVTNIIQSEMDDLREVLMQGLMRGDNPRTVALDLVGRINKATGKREGGYIGLSKPQKQWLQNATGELRSANPSLLQNYLDRTLRDRRYDKYVREAITTGKPIDPAVSQTMLNRYSDSLLRLRGETIGRTEMMQALGEAKEEAYRQVLETGAIKKEQIVRVWQTGGDNRVRDSHSFMHDQRRGIDEPFVSGDGNLLMYPMDPSAPAEEVINCRCITIDEIDYFAGVE